MLHWWIRYFYYEASSRIISLNIPLRQLNNAVLNRISIFLTYRMKLLLIYIFLSWWSWFYYFYFFFKGIIFLLFGTYYYPLWSCLVLTISFLTVFIFILDHLSNSSLSWRTQVLVFMFYFIDSHLRYVLFSHMMS